MREFPFVRTAPHPTHAGTPAEGTVAMMACRQQGPKPQHKHPRHTAEVVKGATRAAIQRPMPRRSSAGAGCWLSRGICTAAQRCAGIGGGAEGRQAGRQADRQPGGCGARQLRWPTSKVCSPGELKRQSAGPSVEPLARACHVAPRPHCPSIFSIACTSLMKPSRHLGCGCSSGQRELRARTSALPKVGPDYHNCGNRESTRTALQEFGPAQASWPAHRRRVFQRIPPASWGPQAGDSQLSDARALGMPVENRPRGQPARAIRATASFSLLAPFAASLIGSRYSRRGVDRAPSQFRGPIPAEAFELCADAGPLPGPRCRDWRTNEPDFRLYRSPPMASPPSTRILLHARLVPRKASATGVCADL